MRDRKNIMFCGFGGQGVVLAGVILGQSAVHDGLNVAQAASYGSEARGSACRSEIIVSGEKIIYPHIRKADILGVMSQPGYDKFKEKVDTGGLIVYDTSMVKADTSVSFEHKGVPATEKAVEELSERIAANIVFLSAIVKLTGVVTTGALEKAVRTVIPAKHLEINLKALEIGQALV